MRLFVSFPQELSIDIILELFPIKITDRQISFTVHDDTVFIHLLYLLQVNDITTVDTHKGRYRQTLLHLFHRKQNDERLWLTFDMDFQILTHTLYI